MKKKLIVGLFLATVLAVGSVAAQDWYNALKSPIKSGRYNAVGVQNTYATISAIGKSGTFSLYIDGDMAMGSYNIEDDQLIIRYNYASSGLSGLSNTTAIYEILSETRFRTGSTLFVYAGY
ncbi:MAG: hypothetical protein IKQ61_12185 [Spirochaetales bacterium]|nr:hypothetical protein [Spirochaetales bacterium]MBR6201006.1 hypothetical protein [Spirochaetales bacterium]